MKKLVLNISEILHQISSAEDQCIDRLIGSLEKRNGIKQVRLDTEESSPKLCIHYNGDIVSANKITQIATETADKLDDTFGHLWIKMRDVRDHNHRQAITALLKNFKGVMNVLVVPTGWIFLEFNTYMTHESILRELVEKIDLIV